MSRARLARRLLGPTVLASLLFSAGTLHAQNTAAVDSRFQPWLGCWRPVDSGVGLEELDGDKQPTRACVVPSTSTPGTVELMMFHRDSLMARIVVPRPGTPLARKIDECDGVESAEWVPGNARLVLKANLSCANGVKRVETGLMTMNESGQWVQFQHLAVGKNEATTVARFRFEGDSSKPAGVDMGTLRSTRSLRMMAGAPVDVSDIVGVAKLVPASLAEGWMAELGPRITLDAKALVQLADGGVPARVIDVMVAMANPDKFQIGPAMMNGRGESQGRSIAALRTGGGSMGSLGLRSRCGMMNDFCYGPGGMGAWGFGYRYGLMDPWGYSYYSPYGPGMWGYNAYSPWGGYGGYGYGRGTYYGGGPIVIVPSGSGSNTVGDGTVRGRAVRGGGYTRDGGGDMRPPSSYSPPASSGSSGSGMGSGGGGGGDGGGRTAKPRGSGGN